MIPRCAGASYSRSSSAPSDCGWPTGRGTSATTPRGRWNGGARRSAARCPRSGRWRTDPHPLANAVSLLLALLGGGALPVAMALSWLSLSALGGLAFLLGRRLYSAWVGVAFAVVVLTRQLLIRETQQAVVDLPFLALILAALLVEAGRPRERTLVPVLLCAAGLLRPEGWLVGLAWFAYAARGRPRAQVVRWAALVVAAPVVWSLWDVVVTGDALWSLHGTQDLAQQLERPRAFGTAFGALPAYLRDALDDPIMWLGLGGAAAGLLGFYERSLLPAALAAAGCWGSSRSEWRTCRS